MLKVIHVSSHSDRVRLYIMYLRQISLKKIDICRKKVGYTVHTLTSKISLCIYICTLIRVFDFPYSDILGPLTVCANRNEIQSAQSDPGCPVRSYEIFNAMTVVMSLVL